MWVAKLSQLLTETYFYSYVKMCLKGGMPSSWTFGQKYFSAYGVKQRLNATVTERN